jgi:hypothetical protein
MLSHIASLAVPRPDKTLDDRTEFHTTTDLAEQLRAVLRSKQRPQGILTYGDEYAYQRATFLKKFAHLDGEYTQDHSPLLSIRWSECTPTVVVITAPTGHARYRFTQFPQNQQTRMSRNDAKYETHWAWVTEDEPKCEPHPTLSPCVTEDERQLTPQSTSISAATMDVAESTNSSISASNARRPTRAKLQPLLPTATPLSRAQREAQTQRLSKFLSRRRGEQPRNRSAFNRWEVIDGELTATSPSASSGRF